MKSLIQHAVSSIRILAFVIAICALVIQPTVQSVSFLGHIDFELVDMDTENDSNEKENQEEDNKDEKVELQLSSPSYLTTLGGKKAAIFSKQALKWDFAFDTHLPPPKQS